MLGEDHDRFDCKWALKTRRAECIAKPANVGTEQTRAPVGEGDGEEKRSAGKEVTPVFDHAAIICGISLAWETPNPENPACRSAHAGYGPGNAGNRSPDERKRYPGPRGVSCWQAFAARTGKPRMSLRSCGLRLRKHRQPQPG